MPDVYLIGDTIRFTANIVNLAGAAYEPESITVSVFSADGTELLSNAEAVPSGSGSYYYDWKVEGTTDKTDLIVVWDWSGAHKKRMEFKVIPETE